MVRDIRRSASRKCLAAQIARCPVFNLDDIRAEVAQQQASEGPLDLLPNLDYPDTRQRLRHRNTSRVRHRIRVSTPPGRPREYGPPINASSNRGELPGAAVRPCVAPISTGPLPTLVPGAGFEPARPFGLPILSRQRLPFRHPGSNLRLDVNAGLSAWWGQETRSYVTLTTRAAPLAAGSTVCGIFRTREPGRSRGLRLSLSRFHPSSRGTVGGTGIADVTPEPDLRVSVMSHQQHSMAFDQPVKTG